MSIRVVAGEIGAQGASTRVTLPTTNQPRWPPFERIAEVIATPRRRFPLHQHEGAEVMTYVIEGAGSYVAGSDPPRLIELGSTQLLTAPTTISHAINPEKGHTVRWFATMMGLPPGQGAKPQLQFGHSTETGPQPDGTAVRHLVGPGSDLRSAVGLEAEAIRFLSEGTSFRRVGHDFLAICYALAGRGLVDNQPLEGGEAAFIEEVGGISVQGNPGFHLIFARSPR